jgi:NADH-quinone oxidoreductase subunit F
MGRNGDIELLLDVCSQIDGRSYCALGDAAAWPIVGAIKAFRPEFEYWIANKRSPVGEDFVPPLPEKLNPLLTLTPA